MALLCSDADHRKVRKIVWTVPDPQNAIPLESMDVNPIAGQYWGPHFQG